MKKLAYILAALLLGGCAQRDLDYGSTVVLDRATLLDKIRGGWAGQTIGCTYGGPTEFKYKGGMIHDQSPIVWYDDYALETFRDDPGLYDDVYMDIIFAEVMAREGIDAPAEAYALAFANADCRLWHANQAARYNILSGIMPPESGHWLNNPHADDIDFQIEADIIGMICPAMPVRAAQLADRIGHIMNCGDGFYGGLFVGTMYSLAFATDRIPTIVSEALRAIPRGTRFRNCIADVIRLHGRYPNDWKRCWQEIDLLYGDEKGCPEGVFNGFNIDAVINSAYVVIGLLYGQGDFFRTMDIATRCGQDSDCNPASAAGILGVVKGYGGIPSYWKPGLEKVEQIDFPYTSTSLETMYPLNLRLIEQTLASQGGRIEGDRYFIPLQRPAPVAVEQAFEGIYPVEKRVLKRRFRDSLELEFNGNGVVVMGQVTQTREGADPTYVAQLEVCIDGTTTCRFAMPYDYIKRKYDIFHHYNLPADGSHRLEITVLNPSPDYLIEAKELVVYASAPLAPLFSKSNKGSNKAIF
ncbi:hypothetical protein FACS1894159_09660 [Bacteroidia bacterium]|nr:hypothetical protein FACS1894159_09660 [Bacteroidia bacterium]